MRIDTQPDDNWLTRRYDLLNTWEIGGCIRAAKLKLRTHEMPGDEPKRTGGKSKVSIIRNGLMVVAQIAYELAIGRRFVKDDRRRLRPAAAEPVSISIVEEQVAGPFPATRRRASGE
jgi:hypothetical protein